MSLRAVRRERLRQNKRSQDQSRQTGCDCRGPELGIGAQEQMILGDILDWD